MLCNRYRWCAEPLQEELILLVYIPAGRLNGRPVFLLPLQGMIWDILIFIVGSALVVLGADWLVDGASAVARRSGLSEFVIGATIVGIGTSMPEFVVSGIAAIQGSAGMAVGNVCGSNIFNTLLILGVTALILPLNYTRDNIRRDIPLCIGVSALFLLFAYLPAGAPDINRWEGIVLLLGFAAYLWYNFKTGKDSGEEETPKAPMPVWKMVGLILLGLGGLIGGGQLFVDSAVSIAQRLSVPESVIGITIVALGTSLPELAVCVAAAVKGRAQMAIGNILGSNISNILLIIGFSATVSPLLIDPVNALGILLAGVSAVLLMLSMFPLRTHRLDRWEGALFVALYLSYIVWLILNR